MSSPKLGDTQLACPQCGQSDKLEVDITATCEVSAHELEIVSDYEWDRDSHCRCPQCDHEDTVAGFIVVSPSLTLDADEAQALRRLVAYCYGDELAHFLEEEPEGRGSHIFRSIAPLALLVGHVTVEELSAETDGAIVADASAEGGAQ